MKDETVGIVAGEADVVRERVEPDVVDVIAIERQLDSPAQPRFRTRNTQVARDFFHRVDQFGLAEVGRNAIRMGAEIIEKPVFVFGEPKVVVLFFAMLDLAPLRAELAIRSAFFVGQELFLANAVVALLFVFVDLLFVVKALQHSLHAFLVQRIGRRGPTVVADFEFLPKRDELRRDLIDELLRRHASFFGGLLDLLAVLIDAGEKENFFTFQPMITRDDVGQHFLVGVSDMRRAIRVIDRGGEVELLRHSRRQ